MTEPLLHLGDVCLVRKSIGGGSCPHGMHAQSVDFDTQASFRSILFHNIPVNGIRIERFFQCAGQVITHGAEEGAGQVIAMTGQQQVVFNEALGHRMQGDISDLVALALHL